MAKKKKKNPWRTSGPLYIVAALWIAWSLIFPLSNAAHFVSLSIASLGAFWVSKVLWPKEIEYEEEEEEKKKPEAEKKTAETAEPKKEEKPVRDDVKKRPRTGDEAIDKLLDEEEKAISEMKRLDEAIEDEKVSAQIVHLEEVTTKIVNCVVETPSKKKQVRKFFNYYLPTVLKLLNAYDRMDETGISGVNIDGTKGKVEEMMDTALASFDKQLDALYADEALDISSEIKVMENMFAAEGVKEDEITLSL